MHHGYDNKRDPRIRFNSIAVDVTHVLCDATQCLALRHVVN